MPWLLKNCMYHEAIQNVFGVKYKDSHNNTFMLPSRNETEVQYAASLRLNIIVHNLTRLNDSVVITTFHSSFSFYYCYKCFQNNCFSKFVNLKDTIQQWLVTNSTKLWLIAIKIMCVCFTPWFVQLWRKSKTEYKRLYRPYP